MRSADLGSVQIRNDVIGSIAALAAREVEGVLGVWRGPLLFRMPMGSSGVKVETRDQEVRLWVNLTVEYGISLPEVALQVQDRVREMVEQMTQLSVAEVHVAIHEVKPKREVAR